MPDDEREEAIAESQTMIAATLYAQAEHGRELGLSDEEIEEIVDASTVFMGLMARAAFIEAQPGGDEAEMEKLAQEISNIPTSQAYGIIFVAAATAGKFMNTLAQAGIDPTTGEPHA